MCRDCKPRVFRQLQAAVDETEMKIAKKKEGKRERRVTDANRQTDSKID